MQRRYIYGAGLDEVLVWTEGGGLSDKRWLTRDHQGSVMSLTPAGSS